MDKEGKKLDSTVGGAERWCMDGDVGAAAAAALRYASTGRDLKRGDNGLFGVVETHRGRHGAGRWDRFCRGIEATIET